MSRIKRKATPMMEFRTVKRIDNSRLVRNVEPAKQRNLYKTVGTGGVVALFFLFYIFQHFRCIDLSFQLEDLKARQAQAAQLNAELKLEIANLRDPMRIDVIAPAAGLDGAAANADARVRGAGRHAGGVGALCAPRAAAIMQRK